MIIRKIPFHSLFFTLRQLIKLILKKQTLQHWSNNFTATTTESKSFQLHDYNFSMFVKTFKRNNKNRTSQKPILSKKFCRKWTKIRPKFFDVEYTYFNNLDQSTLLSWSELYYTCKEFKTSFVCFKQGSQTQMSSRASYEINLVSLAT